MGKLIRQENPPNRTLDKSNPNIEDGYTDTQLSTLESEEENDLCMQTDSMLQNSTVTTSQIIYIISQEIDEYKAQVKVIDARIKKLQEARNRLNTRLEGFCAVLHSLKGVK